MSIAVDDPRLHEACCGSLTPVTVVHENPWFRVCDRAGYFTVEYHHPQVTVVPVVSGCAVVMVRVRRPVIADVVWELPAGGSHSGETPAETAARELAEEAGIGIADLRRFRMLPPLCIMPRNPQLPFLFRIDISQEEFDRRGPHDGEVAVVESYTFDEVRDKIARSEIYMSLPVAVLARFLLRTAGDLTTEAAEDRGGA